MAGYGKGNVAPGIGNGKTPGSFVASNAGGDMKDKLGRLGRHGDSQIRNVDGMPSHVNAYEAYLIDNFGDLGEDMTREIGSGTINPDTGLLEYAPKWLSKTRSWWKRKGRKGARKLGFGKGAGLSRAFKEFTGWTGETLGLGNYEAFSSDKKQELVDYENAQQTWEKTKGDVISSWNQQKEALADQWGAQTASIDQGYSADVGNLFAQSRRMGPAGQTGSAYRAMMGQARDLGSAREIAYDKEFQNYGANLDKMYGRQLGEWRGLQGTFEGLGGQVVNADPQKWLKQGSRLRSGDDYFKGTAYEIETEGRYT